MEQQFPGLVYAKGTVLLADSKQCLQQLTDACGEETADLGSEFSTAKGGVLDFNDDSRNE